MILFLYITLICKRELRYVLKNVEEIEELNDEDVSLLNDENEYVSLLNDENDIILITNETNDRIFNKNELILLRLGIVLICVISGCFVVYFVLKIV